MLAISEHGSKLTLMEQSAPRRTTYTLPADLQESVSKYAPLLGLTHHQFVNQCVGQIIQGFESDDIIPDLPLLKLGRIMLGKTTSDSKFFKTILSMIAPTAEELTDKYREALCEVMKNHDGPLTKEVWEVYRHQAMETARLRAVAERKLAKVKNSKGDGK
jgi:hypothetical protein